MGGQNHFYMTLTGLLLAASFGGCVIGPTALEVSRVGYNQAIQRTTNEELLLNLVRLQYREAPLFFEVASVSAQFSFGESASITGILNEGPNPINPDRLDLRAGIDYMERPTITFSPLQGKEFVEKLLSPLQLEMIVLLSRSGWNIDRVLRLTVQTMNGLDNASSASGPTPERAPRYEKFARVSQFFRELQEKGLLQWVYESRETEFFGPLPTERVSLPDVVDAVSQGYRVRPSEDGSELTVSSFSRVLVWQIPPAARDTEEVAKIVELLGLLPERSRYDIRVGDAGGPVSGVGPGERTQINILPRSLMGTLFYLAQAVEVPGGNREKGLVTTTLGAQGQPFDWKLVTGGLLRVHWQTTRPRRPAVAVRHRGFWYYIDDADLSSKSTFGMLGQLFALQAGGADGVVPVLTLPVGG